ncbi:SIS domain-containing protein [Neptunicella marina]|uniref:SIS domain-containing protein n=1 Tax=Neptunicella marina TaxID=2125989 RepID=A0A8J6IW89_9ALTE|nr:SIS domain-containing protein [Neptunicella marina]MBC3766528.1 SIS domain-containing protein [Neptunicella marina]
MTYLTYSDTQLEQLDGYWTAREISQQPASWLTAVQNLEQMQAELDEFLKPILSTPNMRIIFTGAGTSAFAGQCVAPLVMKHHNIRAEAIATTDLVSNPHEYFQTDVPTLLVSFARSGNSPESVAAVKIAEQLVTDCYQLALTCNEEGLLAKHCNGNKRKTVLMPTETNDRSFAMTSSFSCMLLSALYLFCPAENFKTQLQQCIDATSSLFNTQVDKLNNLSKQQFKRVVYLGSGIFKGLAQESALKLLELTDGKTLAAFDSPLGFRHGPKTMVDNQTLVVVFIANDSYTRKYDVDLLLELNSDAEAGHVLAITTSTDDIPNLPDSISMVELSQQSDSLLLLPYIACAQMYSFFSAINVGNTPDNPSASGTVNRVVQGVNIHPLK